MKSRHSYQVKDVARLAKVSVRALHHYDDIGLFVPKDRTDAGYRLYTDDDLLRLQQILIGRELGLSLEEIRRSLDEPGFDRRKVLLQQKKALEERQTRTTQMISALEAALAALNPKGKETKMSELFEGFDAARYEREAEEHWGSTEAYKESHRRTKAYTAADWAKHKAEAAAIYADASSAQRAGKRPDSAAAMDVAERHRQLIDRWFYPCSAEMHRGLADLYEADVRFAKNIDKHGEGLTVFLCAAIRANAGRGS